MRRPVFATGMLHVHQQAWPEAEQVSVFSRCYMLKPSVIISAGMHSLSVLFSSLMRGAAVSAS